MVVIYIASPYTVGDQALNVKRQMDCAEELIRLGYCPHIPLLTHFQHIAHPHPYEVWLKMGFEYVKRCDAVLRLHGESRGADLETAFASEHGIPVFETIDELRKIFE